MSESSDHALLLQASADNAKLLRAWETTVNKLNKNFDSIEKGAKKSAQAAEDAFAKPNIGKSLQKFFDSTRFTVLEEGATRARLFGSALEPLGAFGLAAAAGVAAFGFAMERTEKAVEFAAGVAKLGKETGTTTDFIQEFNFAARQSEVDVGQADVALKKLNQSLGLVQSGLARKQLANAFKAIGFTPEQLRQYHDVGDFFPVLVDRISKIGDAAEQAAIAKRLGIEELLPLLQNGATNFNVLAKAARDLGVVMDEATIKKAEEAKVKLNELDQVMKAKANITFAQFAGTLVKLKGHARRRDRLPADDRGDHRHPAIGDKIERLQKQRDNLAINNLAHRQIPCGRPCWTRRSRPSRSWRVGKAPRRGLRPSPHAKPLVNGSPSSARSDPTLGFDKSAQDAYDSGLKALITAQAALLVDVVARAAAEKQASTPTPPRSSTTSTPRS
jgi:hypothetical protein